MVRVQNIVGRGGRSGDATARRVNRYNERAPVYARKRQRHGEAGDPQYRTLAWTPESCGATAKRVNRYTTSGRSYTRKPDNCTELGPQSE